MFYSFFLRKSFIHCGRTNLSVCWCVFSINSAVIIANVRFLSMLNQLLTWKLIQVWQSARSTQPSGHHSVGRRKWVPGKKTASSACKQDCWHSRLKALAVNWSGRFGWYAFLIGFKPAAASSKPQKGMSVTKRALTYPIIHAKFSSSYYWLGVVYVCRRSSCDMPVMETSSNASMLAVVTCQWLLELTASVVDMRNVFVSACDVEVSRTVY